MFSFKIDNITDQFCHQVTEEYPGFNVKWNKTKSGVTVDAHCTAPKLNGQLQNCMVD